jgi:hypothetical protein
VVAAHQLIPQEETLGQIQYLVQSHLPVVAVVVVKVKAVEQMVAQVVVGWQTILLEPVTHLLFLLLKVIMAVLDTCHLVLLGQMAAAAAVHLLLVLLQIPMETQAQVAMELHPQFLVRL